MSLNILFHGEKQVDDIHLGYMYVGGSKLYDIPPSTLYYKGKEYNVVERTNMSYDNVFELGKYEGNVLWNLKHKDVDTMGVNVNGFHYYDSQYAPTNIWTTIKSLRYVNVSPTIFDGKYHTSGVYPCWNLVKNVTSLGGFVSQIYSGQSINLNKVKLNFCQNWRGAFYGTNAFGTLSLNTHPDVARWDNYNYISGGYVTYYYSNADTFYGISINHVGTIGENGYPSYVKYGRYANGAIYGDKATRDFSNTFYNTNISSFSDYSPYSICNVIETNLSQSFTYCSNLTSFYAPKYNVSNGYHAFESCRNLTSITLGGGNNTFYCNIENMFTYCYNLTSVSIVGGVNNLPYSSGTFFYCNSLTTLNSVFTRTFYYSRLSCNVSSMFQGCTNLRNIGTFESRNFPSSANLSCLFEECKNIALNYYSTVDSYSTLTYYKLRMFDSINSSWNMDSMFYASSLGMVNAQYDYRTFFDFKNIYQTSLSSCFGEIGRGIRVEGVYTNNAYGIFSRSNILLGGNFTLKSTYECNYAFTNAHVITTTKQSQPPSNVYLNNVRQAYRAFCSVELLYLINNIFIGSNQATGEAVNRNYICRMLVNNNGAWYNTSNYSINFKHNCTSTQSYEMTTTYYGFNMRAYFYNNSTIYLNIYNKGNSKWANRSIRIYNNQTADANVNLCFANARF